MPIAYQYSLYNWGTNLVAESNNYPQIVQMLSDKSVFY